MMGCRSSGRRFSGPQTADATRIQQQANSVSTAQPRGLNVTWMQLRGPAKIAFGATGATMVADEQAATSARFPLAGMYVIRATANDGALVHEITDLDD